MTPRRILLLLTDLQIGGTPTVVRELATRLHRPAGGVHVEVACLKGWGPVADPLRDAGVTVTAFGATRPWQLPGVVRRVRRLVRERSIDTVFSFLVHANAVAAVASRRLPGGPGRELSHQRAGRPAQIRAPPVDQYDRDRHGRAGDSHRA